MRLTRKVNPSFEPYTAAFTSLLIRVLEGFDLREAVELAGKELFGEGVSVKHMVERSGGEDPMVACYINSSFPALLFFLYKYADSDAGTVALANANAGGENVARGSLLGAVIGARGKPFPAWCNEGLMHKNEIAAELDAFVEALSVE